MNILTIDATPRRVLSNTVLFQESTPLVKESPSNRLPRFDRFYGFLSINTIRKGEVHNIKVFIRKPHFPENSLIFFDTKQYPSQIPEQTKFKDLFLFTDEAQDIRKLSRTEEISDLLGLYAGSIELLLLLAEEKRLTFTLINSFFVEAKLETENLTEIITLSQKLELIHIEEGFYGLTVEGKNIVQKLLDFLN